MSSTKKRSRQPAPSPSPSPALTVEKVEPAATPSESVLPVVPTLPAPSDRFWLGAFVVLMIGIALRQINLGPAPFHPDESIHAYFSQNFGGYHYDPVYHGPLLYHLTSAIFAIFGQYDYTARLMPSLMGIILLLMVVVSARQWMGSRGAIAATGLLAFSTSVVTYSRHLLHDALALVLTFGAVLCFASMWNHPANTSAGRNARLGLAAFLTLFLATKANCFFIMAMLLAFYLAWRGVGRFTLSVAIGRWLPVLCFVGVSLGSVIFPRDNTSPTPVRDLQHSIFQAIALSGCVCMWFWLLLRTPDDTERETKRKWLLNSDALTYVLAIGVFWWLYAFLFGNEAQILQQFVQTKTFPTQTFIDGRTSAQTAISKMLHYWGGQQKHPRLPSRHDYYIVLSLLYEVPILLAAIGGVWHFAKNRSVWTDLLLWWGFTSWAVYAVANEKVPWLLVHMMLPFALLGGMWLGQIQWKKPVLALAVLLGVVFSGRGDFAMIFQRAGDNAEPILYAQTPDSFRDALNEAMETTRDRTGGLGMAGDKQWPAVWYFRRNNPPANGSGQAIGGILDLNKLRVVVGQPAAEDKDVADPAKPGVDPQEDLAMMKAGWDRKTVDFLIWPRATWPALRPDRYWRWWWTRDTLPKSERDQPSSQWDQSILSDGGEWSNAKAVIGHVK